MKSIKYLLKNHKNLNKEKIIIKGWISSARGNKNIYFVKLNDGSTFYDVQVVFKKNDVKDFENLQKLKMGYSIMVEGELINTPNSNQQSFEVVANNFTTLGRVDSDYPLQKKETSKEFLRDLPHLRHRTSFIRSIMNIRSRLMIELHKFFDNNNFLYFNNPVITGNDGEGAGESFNVVSQQKNNFFGTNATLCVTGQLHAEAYANGFGKVYTFSPTFRAENSHTRKHLAEFWMLEPEVCFYDLNKIIELSEDMLKTVIKKVIEKCSLELDYLSKKNETNLKEKLEKFINSKMIQIDYSEAIEILLKNKNQFKNKNIEFGMDMDTEHERFLAENEFKSPIFVKNYPKDIKAFYMFQNDDGITVKAFDALFPNIGEMIGGSQREENYEKLLNRINELKMDPKKLKWYLDIRKYGYPGSSGFGLGFERLVMYVTGVDNIRDVIPFPRTPNSLLA